MASSFRVDSVILSDYFTQDIAGKSVIAGVYASELVFALEPAYFPPLFMILTVIPLEPQFDAELKILTPGGDIAVTFLLAFKADRDVNQFSRVTYNIQLPIMKFYGAGIYTIDVSPTGKKPLYSKKVNVIVGDQSGESLGKVEIRLGLIKDPVFPR